MNRKYLVATVSAVLLSGALFADAARQAPSPRLLWNASASAPVGFYIIERDVRPRVGDLVAIHPPAALGGWLADRNYIPLGVPLLKRVAGLPGACVCRTGTFVTVDGHGVARAMPRDRLGRKLPIWRGCRTVAPQQIFLVNASSESLDGRYFGPLLDAGLLGVARPVLTRDAPGAPLRWRRGADRHPFSHNDQE